MILHALRILHQTYRSLGWRTRFHTLVRFLTCPFFAIVRAIPGDARSLLEIGAGHGVLARLASERVAWVVAVEPDIRKAFPKRSVRFVVGYDTAIRGTFDVVVLVDVLYLIPIGEWDAVLSRARERLAPGGTLLIKEQDPEARWKNAWNRVQEWLSIRVLRITLGTAFAYEPPGRFVHRLERLGFRDVSARRIDRGYPHPHILYTARAAGRVPGSAGFQPASTPPACPPP